MSASREHSQPVYTHRAQVLKMFGVLLTIFLLYGCQSAPSTSTTGVTSTPHAEISPTMMPTVVSTLPERQSEVAAPTPDGHATYTTMISNAWASSTRHAQLYPNLQPDITASFDAFKQYPGAQYLYESDTWPGVPLWFELETNDNVEVAEAYYHDLAKRQGWQVAPVNSEDWWQLPRYYYGDYGQKHVYGYYLKFFVVKGGQHLNTYVRVWVNRSLPVYLGATDVVEKSRSHMDTGESSIEFITEDQPSDVFAFYKDLLPEDDWVLATAESSDTRLLWQIGQNPQAEVTAEREPTGKTRVRVKAYSRCCG
jgi:hypothetical protein